MSLKIFLQLPLLQKQKMLKSIIGLAGEINISHLKPFKMIPDYHKYALDTQFYLTSCSQPEGDFSN